MEQRELKEIIISAVVLAIAFGIVLSRMYDINLEILILVSFITVSTGFILHELGHRFVAKNFGAYAEYRLWNTGLILAFVSSLFGFIFAAPGAVYIHPKADLWGRQASITRRVSGIISIAGPLINISLAMLFFVINIFYPLGLIAEMGIYINIWLALFNMLPFPPLDGSKVFLWDKKLWVATFGVIAILFMGYSSGFF